MIHILSEELTDSLVARVVRGSPDLWSFITAEFEGPQFGVAKLPEIQYLGANRGGTVSVALGQYGWF